MAGCAFCAARFLRDRRQKNDRATIAINTTAPPTAPPAMAPTCELAWLEALSLEVGAADAVDDVGIDLVATRTDPG
jgi:hypothetical protein